MTTYRGSPPDRFSANRGHRLDPPLDTFAANDSAQATNGLQWTGIYRVGALVVGGIVSWMLVLVLCKILVDAFHL